MEKKSRVCVTGAARYIGSWLVNKLLQRGHVVHATLRNIVDPLKTGILKRFSGAETRLLLFQADIYDPDKFEAAIQGCEFVFLVATPLQHNPNGSQDYVSSKTLSEKEILSFDNKAGNRGIEVVSLVCGLVGGDALLPHVPGSIQAMVSPLTGDQTSSRQLKFIQALLGLVPLVHIEDVCEAHAFCMERPSMSGRFLCASSNPTLQQIVFYYQHNYPEILVKTEVEMVTRTELRSTKLTELGFEYKYNEKEIIEEVLNAQRNWED